MGKVELVVFDLGGVMVSLVQGWQHACQRAGVPYHPQQDAPHARQAIQRLVCLHEVGKLEPDFWTREMAKVVGLDPLQVMAIYDAWMTGPYPGWHALLDRLETAGLRTACLSNTNAHHWKLIHDPVGANHLPVGRLTHRFASHLIGSRKPEPAIYQHAEKETGVAPEAILFFDDLPANVEGARAHGWAAELIDPTRDPVEQITLALKRHAVL